MKFILEGIRRSRIESQSSIRLTARLMGLFALLFAFRVDAQVTATPSSINLTCSTTAGPGSSVSVVVRPVTPIALGGSAIPISLGTLPSGIVVTPTTASLTTANQTAGITFTVKATAGCAGATAGTNSVSFRFAYGASPTLSATVTISHTVTASASALTPTPTSIAMTCVLDTGVYTPGPAQSISVSSSVTQANGGTPFTISTAGNASGTGAAWATASPLTSLNANSTTPASISVVPTAGCGGFSLGTTNTTSITLLNAPAPNKAIPVTMKIIAPTPLTAAPSSASLTYVKGSGSAGRADILLSPTAGAPFFSVDTTTLPIWLTVDAVNGTAPRSLRFSTTTVADTLAAGTYTASVRVRVANFGDLVIPVNLFVNNPPAKMTVSEGTTRNLSWVVGQPLPTLLITAVSSDSPIPFTLVTGGKLAPIVAPSQQSGLAYGFGTQIPVSFDDTLFASAVPGTILTGTVSLTWGNPAQTIVVTINVSVQSAGATVTGISPASLPTATPGTIFTAVLSGSGFVTGTDPTLRTKVGIVTAGVLVYDTNITSTVVNGSNITLTIIVPTVPDAALPFAPAGTGGTVVIGICNPINGTCSTPSGTATLTIGNNPIIQAVTSASAYTQVNSPAIQTIAPYDMITIFGTNFCTSGGTGCSSSQVLYGNINATTMTYGRSVSPDAVSSTQRSLVVTFQTQGGSPTVIATAPILFATNNQINVMVPAALSAQIGSNIDMVVSFGYGTGATQKSSTPFPLTIAATNPGLFTIGSSGQGDGAALDSRYSVISASNPAAIRTNAGSVSGGTSETVQLYLTGLGAPSAGADNANTGTSGNPTWGTDCISTASYLVSLNGLANSSLTTIDGSILLSSLLNTDRLVPCIATGSSNSPTVTIGGRAATVTYAGFVPDGIAGLYQINAKLPINGAASLTNTAGTVLSSLTAATQLPVVITANGRSSQTGVSIWVTPRLRVLPPSGGGLTGTVGVAWASSNNAVVASEGTSPYRYALTSGLLPAGLVFNTVTGAISGTPLASTSGTYLVTVTATDSANVPVTGTSSFTVTVAGGLYVSATGTSPFTGTFGTANASLTTVSASGGTYPYTYAITSPGTLPTGMTVGSTSGVVGISSLTPAGNYNITVTATDAAATPVTGSISFALNHELLMTPTSSATPSTGTGGPVRTITATGGTGTISYATTTSGFTVNSSTGVVSSTNGTAAGTYNVVITATDSTTAPGATSAATGSITISATVVP